MRYMLLVRNEPSAWSGWDSPSDGFEATVRFMDELNAELMETGELVAGAGLADPALGVTVRANGGATVTTDGPFAESKEVLGGYWVLDCASYDRAVAVATRVVEFDGVHSPHTVEIRPIMDANCGLEM